MLKVLHMLRCKWTCGVILHYAAMSNLETIYKDDASGTKSHGCIQLTFFTTALDHERLRDHIHQITFQLTCLDLTIQNIQRGISCNTCRLVGQHHQRSENIRHQIWRNIKVFLWQMQNVWACRFLPSRSLGPLPLKGPELSLAFWRVGCLGEVRSSPAWSSFIRQHRSKI